MRKDRISNVMIHILTMHTNKLKCPICSKQMQSFSRFNTHMHDRHKTVGYDDKRDLFKGTSVLAKVQKTAEVQLKLVDTFWDCFVCKKRCKGYTDLENHMTEKHLEGTVRTEDIFRDRRSMLINCLLFQPPRCPVCQKRFVDNPHTYRHILKAHMGKWDCPYCVRRLDSRDRLKAHLMYHNVDLPDT